MKQINKVVVVLIVVALATGFYVLRDDSGSVPNLVSDSNPVGVNTTPYNGTWRFVSTSDKPDELGALITEVDKDGNYRTISDKTISLTVGNATYARPTDGQGSWQQSSNGLYNPINAINDIFLEELLLDGIQIEYQGDGNCLAGRCRIYKITDLNKQKKLSEVGTRTASISEGEVKIDVKNNRPSEHVVTHTRATPSETTYETITTIFEFDVDFDDIELPQDTAN